MAIEEAKNPSKTVPQATVLSLLIVTILYALAGASLTYLISYKEINIESAFAHAYSLSKWAWARYAISIAIVFSAGGNLLSGTYGSIRIIYAMSTDGLLPSKLSYVSQVRHVPIVATCFVCLITALLGSFFDIKDLIGFTDISALLSYTGVSVGLLIERYNHELSYGLLSTNENEEEEEETFELDNQKNDDTTQVNMSTSLESDPFLTRFMRSLFRPCVPLIDSYCSPKTWCIIFLLIFIVNTCLLAIIIRTLTHDRIFHLVIIILCSLIQLILIVAFCLLRPKKHSNDLLFTCPGVPLIPLVNVTAFIFLMVVQDVHDWLAYSGIILTSLLIYFAYSYWHSKSR